MALPKGKILQRNDYNVLVASHEPYIMQKNIEQYLIFIYIWIMTTNVQKINNIGIHIYTLFEFMQYVQLVFYTYLI